MDQPDIEKSLRHNLVYNILDGAFFGLAIGFASFVTIIPLFVSTLTNSAILIGLVPAMHSAGWYLPQLFMANKLSGQSRFKPLMMRFTIHERLPFIGLAVVAWMSPQLDKKLAILLVFGLLIWQGLGSGFAANPWQNMIGKVIPGRMLGIFFGAQSGAANVLMAVGALATGFLLERVTTPKNFSVIFFLAGIALMLSMLALSRVRESPHPITQVTRDRSGFRLQLQSILVNDIPFRKFLVVRSLMEIGVMAIGFYTVFVVRRHGAPGSAIGVMAASMSVTKVFANIILGRIGDRRSHRVVLQVGAIALSLSALVAWLAPTYQWFFLAFILAGIAHVTSLTTPMAMVLQFGDQNQRPAYIGLANTITAPSALLAPVLGGWLADTAGFQATFMLAVFAGVLMFGVLQTMAGRKSQQAPSSSIPQ